MAPKNKKNTSGFRFDSIHVNRREWCIVRKLIKKVNKKWFLVV